MANRTLPVKEKRVPLWPSGAFADLQLGRVRLLCSSAAGSDMSFRQPSLECGRFPLGPYRTQTANTENVPSLFATGPSAKQQSVAQQEPPSTGPCVCHWILPFAASRAVTPFLLRQIKRVVRRKSNEAGPDTGRYLRRISPFQMTAPFGAEARDLMFFRDRVGMGRLSFGSARTPLGLDVLRTGLRSVMALAGNRRFRRSKTKAKRISTAKAPRRLDDSKARPRPSKMGPF